MKTKVFNPWARCRACSAPGTEYLVHPAGSFFHCGTPRCIRLQREDADRCYHAPTGEVRTAAVLGMLMRRIDAYEPALVAMIFKIFKVQYLRFCTPNSAYLVFNPGDGVPPGAHHYNQTLERISAMDYLHPELKTALIGFLWVIIEEQKIRSHRRFDPVHFDLPTAFIRDNSIFWTPFPTKECSRAYTHSRMMEVLDLVGNAALGRPWNRPSSQYHLMIGLSDRANEEIRAIIRTGEGSAPLPAPPRPPAPVLAA